MAQCQFGGGGECENDATFEVLPIAPDDGVAKGGPIPEASSLSCDDHLAISVEFAMTLATEELPAEDPDCTRVILNRLSDGD